MTQTTAAIAARYFFVDLIGGIVAFPVWWYTRGAVLAFAWAGGSIRDSARALALGVWVKNLFVPMFGERGAEGRIISFFVRLAVVILRGISVGVWSLLVGLLLLAYLVVPLVAIGGLLFNVSGVFAFL